VIPLAGVLVETVKINSSYPYKFLKTANNLKNQRLPNHLRNRNLHNHLQNLLKPLRSNSHLNRNHPRLNLPKHRIQGVLMI
jgi:hypothetical protein